MVLVGGLLSRLLGTGHRSGSGRGSVRRADRTDFGALPRTPSGAAARGVSVIAPFPSHSSYYFAAMCFVLSGLIMGVLLAGSVAISVALFVALLIGGSLGFYFSRASR
jgi:hypothetical protein